MSTRYTIKQLKEMNDKLFIECILNERRNALSNVYAPLSLRIQYTLKRLEKGTLTGYTQAKEPNHD